MKGMIYLAWLWKVHNEFPEILVYLKKKETQHQVSFDFKDTK